MQRMEFFVCIPKGKQGLPVRRSSRFQYENEPRSSSSADFSGTAKSGRKIKKRRVSFQARQQRDAAPDIAHHECGERYFYARKSVYLLI